MMYVRVLFRFIIVAVGFFLWSPKSFFFPSLRYLFGLGFEYFRVWFFCGVVLVGKNVSFSLFVAHREKKKKKKKKKTFDDLTTTTTKHHFSSAPSREEEEEEEEEGDFFLT